MHTHKSRKWCAQKKKVYKTLHMLNSAQFFFSEIPNGPEMCAHASALYPTLTSPTFNHKVHGVHPCKLAYRIMGFFMANSGKKMKKICFSETELSALGNELGVNEHELLIHSSSGARTAMMHPIMHHYARVSLQYLDVYCFTPC